MANEINIDVFTVTVLNESDGLIVIIDLKNVWEFLIPHSFLHVQCSLSVPTLDKGIASTIQLSLQETFEIKNISAFEKSVSLINAAPETLDSSRTLSGTASILCYDKILTT